MNKWKTLFFAILSVNVVALIIFLIMIYLPSGTGKLKNSYEEVDAVHLTVDTNKADLTQLINNYLKKEMKDRQLNYKVLLTEKVLLIGTIPVFGKEIDLVMTFEPEAQKNGNLLLKQESITLGQVQLPVSFVLRYISDNYPLPEWVIIDSKKKLVKANLSEMKTKSDLRVKVDTFNLKEDKLKFKLLIPTGN